MENKLYNFPVRRTSFVGRTDEVAVITDLLTDPACRLLTLIGVGGIGKTRLAAQVATERLPDFADGVYFAALQSVSSADLLVSAIADALHFSLRGQESPETQVFNYLQEKEMLLVLDNLEHLLSETGVDFISTLLQTCPKTKLLVTSREVLNLEEEWLYYVRGMPVPALTPSPASTGEKSWEDVETGSAMQLFVERARRVRRDFSLVDEYTYVVRICQLVEGMPLAIELAAPWTKTLPCSEIAAEIQHNIDFLTTNLRNVPEHHRSMRAVFDQTWRALLQKERDVFQRLSVFRGSFKYEAAKQVAGASLPILSALIDKSLLRSGPDGRYHIHNVLRQYGAEQLAQQPEDVNRVYDLHSDYYAHFLQRREQDIFSTKQKQVIQEIAAEWENIRAAWQWVVNQVNDCNIRRAASTYYQFCDSQGRFREATDAFEKAITGLTNTEKNRETQSTLALLHVMQGWNYIRLGHFDKARMTFEQSQTMYRTLEIEPPPGFGTDPLLGLALLAHIVGDYDEALTLGEEARRQNEARNDRLNLQIAYYALGNAALAQGSYKTAEKHLQQAHTLTQQTGNSWMMAYVLNELGNVARGLGHFERASQHYQAGYQLKETLNDPEGKAVALNHLAQVAVLEENHAEAKRLYQQSLSFYQDINDRGGLAASLNGLGMAECALGNFQAARQHFQQALQITTDMHFVPLTLYILIGVGEMLLQTGRAESGVELLALALHHPAGDRETKDRAKKCLDYFQAQLSVDSFEVAFKRGQTAKLDTVIPTVQAELSAPVPATSSGEQTSNEAQPLSSPDQSVLVEPLTPRELEVLHLMAEGHTNRQIAEELIISVGTAKWYTGEIYGKLGVNNRTQAVAQARDLGLLG